MTVELFEKKKVQLMVYGLYVIKYYSEYSVPLNSFIDHQKGQIGLFLKIFRISSKHKAVYKEKHIFSLATERPRKNL